MKANEFCEWYDYLEYYDTKCGHSFTFNDGSVEENGYKYCPNCGKKIILNP
jgi:DNA-directed RNA polymerase subunit RPC12/RpoP